MNLISKDSLYYFVNKELGIPCDLSWMVILDGIEKPKRRNIDLDYCDLDGIKQRFFSILCSFHNQYNQLSCKDRPLLNDYIFWRFNQELVVKYGDYLLVECKDDEIQSVYNYCGYFIRVYLNYTFHKIITFAHHASYDFCEHFNLLEPTIHKKHAIILKDDKIEVETLLSDMKMTGVELKGNCIVFDDKAELNLFNLLFSDKFKYDNISFDELYRNIQNRFINHTSPDVYVTLKSYYEEALIWKECELKESIS